MARRHRGAPGFGFGPVTAVETEEARGEGFDRHRPKAFFPEKAGEPVAEVAGIERLGGLDLVAVGHRSDETVVGASARGKSDFPKQTGRLLGQLPFEDGSQLVDDGATEREARRRGGGGHGSS